MNRYDEDKEIDIKDLIAILLSRIMPIVICTVFVGVMALGYAVITGNNNRVEIPTEETIAEAREALTLSDADTVDRVYEQYLSYTAYKESLQKYFNNNLLVGDDLESYIQKVIIYSLSSNVEGADSVFASLSLTPDVYALINEVLPDDDTISNVYNRVWISSSERNNLTLLNEDEDGVYIPNEYTLTVNVIARTSNQCDEIGSIVEDAIFDQLNDFRKTDPNARISLIGSNYTENLSGWLISKQNDAINQLNSVENTIKNFNNNQVNNLSAEQKAYYNLLVARDADQPLRIEGPSKKKFLVIGAFGGFVLACGWIVLQYLFNSSIKTKEDISVYNIPVLNVVNIDGKKHPIFNRFIRKLRDISDQDMDTSIQMAATDIGILADKSNTSSIYLVETSGTEEENAIANKLIEKIKSIGSYNISAGKPLESPEELKKMSEAENIVLLAEIQKTKMNLTDKYYEVFQRYNSNVLGSIVSVRP